MPEPLLDSAPRQPGFTLNVARLLEQIADTAVQLTGGERAYLLLYDEHGELRRSTVRHAAPAAASPAEPADLSEMATAVVQAVLSHRQARLAAVAERAILCAPLPGSNNSQGVLYVDRPQASGPFSPDDRERLAAFAAQAAVTIENADLFRETDKALARRVEELSLFQRIDQELNKSLDLDHTLGLALDWAMSLTGADSGSIGLLRRDEDGRHFLELLVYRGEEHAGPQVVALDHPILAEVLATGQAVYSSQVTPTQAIDGTAAVSQLAVPVQRDHQIAGLITLESHQIDAFSRDDILFVERFADRAAVAIENARLFAGVQAAHASKNEFISIVTHELRIPLTSIRGYVDLMAGGLAGPLNEQQTEFLAVVQRNLERMSVLLRDLGDLNRMQSGRMRFEKRPFDLPELIANTVENLAEMVAGRQHRLTVETPPDLPPVQADPNRVGQMLGNLLSNAVKYTPEGGEIVVTATLQDGLACVAVRDNGIGISPEDQAQLFSEFFRSEVAAVREQTGWGLGLSIVKKMAEAQGGQVNVISAPGAGSTFSFTLPLAGNG